MNAKNYFGIGFKNDSDGFEIRNSYSKICLGKKDMTTIENDSNSLRIFEGFVDFLSFKNVENYLEKEPADYLILNSVSMINKIKNSIQNYKMNTDCFKSKAGCCITAKNCKIDFNFQPIN